MDLENGVDMKNSTANSNLKRNETKWGYFFISPCIIGLLVFSLGPILFSLVISFTEWNIISPMKFIGLQNYKDLFQDDLMWKALKVTGFYTLLTVPLTTMVTFLIALLLNSGVKGISIFRTVFYIPSIVPAVASSALWMFIYNPMFGLLNMILKMLHLPTSNFIFSKSGVIPCLAIMAVWGAGNTVVIYLAGLQGVSRQLYEAAEIDGANIFAKFFHITIPMMTPIIFYNLVMGIINSMQTFTQAYIMTNGGPDNASLFYALLLYRTAFKHSMMGYASALSWIFFVIIALLTLIIFKTSDKWVYYDN